MFVSFFGRRSEFYTKSECLFFIIVGKKKKNLIKEITVKRIKLKLDNLIVVNI